MKTICFIASLAMLFTLSGCSSNDNHSDDFAVYYWRTTLNLDDAESRFLADNHINKIYMRYFDVVNDYNGTIPNATITFNDSIPADIEVIPVVFITNSAMYGINYDIESYATKIVDRVKAMSHSNNWPLHELQLDCDWTERTRGAYFDLCRLIKKRLSQDSISLSATIRLHQLTQDAPPVDRGMLMVYNTGTFREIDTNNSIFDIDDIRPYLDDGRLEKYPLQLDVAWPVYGWSVIFDDNGRFNCLDSRIDYSGIDDLTEVAPGRYVAEDYIQTGQLWLGPDYQIRVEQPLYDDIKAVKKIIDRKIGSDHLNVIYHLDSKQFSNYKPDEIKNILNAD